MRTVINHLLEPDTAVQHPHDNEAVLVGSCELAEIVVPRYLRSSSLQISEPLTIMVVRKQILRICCHSSESNFNYSIVRKSQMRTARRFSLGLACSRLFGRGPP